MDQTDIPFRIAVLVLFIGARYVRWHARHLISWSASWPAMKKHPTDTAVLIALSIGWLAAVVIYAAFPRLVEPFRAAIPDSLRWGAIPVALAGLGLLYWADRCLGANLSVSLAIRDQHTLITHGPYRWVRHPIYTATLIYSAALSLITANYVLTAMIFLPMAVLIGTRLPREERMMLDHFGDQYRAYMRRTGRLIPRLRNVRG